MNIMLFKIHNVTDEFFADFQQLKQDILTKKIILKDYYENDYVISKNLNIDKIIFTPNKILQQSNTIVGNIGTVDICICNFDNEMIFFIELFKRIKNRTGLNITGTLISSLTGELSPNADPEQFKNISLVNLEEARKSDAYNYYKVNTCISYFDTKYDVVFYASTSLTDYEHIFGNKENNKSDKDFDIEDER